MNVQLEKKNLKQTYLPRKVFPFYNKNLWKIKTILTIQI